MFWNFQIHDVKSSVQFCLGLFWSPIRSCPIYLSRILDNLYIKKQSILKISIKRPFKKVVVIVSRQKEFSSKSLYKNKTTAPWQRRNVVKIAANECGAWRNLANKKRRIWKSQLDLVPNRYQIISKGTDPNMQVQLNI
jgi:hypothetical protein